MSPVRVSRLGFLAMSARDHTPYFQSVDIKPLNIYTLSKPPVRSTPCSVLNSKRELKAQTNPVQCCRVRTPETCGSIARAIIRDETELVAHISPAFRGRANGGNSRHRGREFRLRMTWASNRRARNAANRLVLSLKP